MATTEPNPADHQPTAPTAIESPAIESGPEPLPVRDKATFAVAVLVAALLGLAVQFMMGWLSGGAAIANSASLPRLAAPVAATSHEPTASTSPTTTGSVGPSTTPSPTPTPSPSLPTIKELPPGSRITVLQSMPQGEFTEAQAWDRAREITNSSYPAVVVDSSSVKGLNPGYWAISVLQNPDASGGTICAAYQRPQGGACYDREVK
jgi:hypothetical protein